VYRACDHDFTVGGGDDDQQQQPIEGHPDGVPLTPFQTLNGPPELWWPELRPSEDALVVLLLDPAVGVVKYLATDFPRNTQARHVTSFNKIVKIR
jgi:hypothetical protein